MPRPERETSRKRTPTPRTYTMRLETEGLERGVVKKVVTTTGKGIVNWELNKDGFLAISASDDSGLGDRIFLPGIGSAKEALDLLKQERTIRKQPRK